MLVLTDPHVSSSPKMPLLVPLTAGGVDTAARPTFRDLENHMAFILFERVHEPIVGASISQQDPGNEAAATPSITEVALPGACACSGCICMAQK